MFLKRELGYLIYFVLILIAKVVMEIVSDGLDVDDFAMILSYTIIITLAFNVLLLFIEATISLVKNQNIRFWKYFKFNDSITVSLIFLLILILTYFIVPKIDGKSLLMWGGIIVFGEVIRIYYNHRIINKAYLDV